MLCLFFFFKQKTAYEMRISDWSSDVCSSDLLLEAVTGLPVATAAPQHRRQMGARNRVAERDSQIAEQCPRLVAGDRYLGAVGVANLQAAEQGDGDGAAAILARSLHPRRPDRKSTRLNSSH